MPIDEYPFGQAVTLKAHFTDEEGAATDPEEMELKLKRRGTKWTVDSNDLVNDSGTGNFSYDVLPDIPGDWSWEWSSSVPFIAVSKGVFHVQEPI